MNPIHTLINDTLALDEKATAAPWATQSRRISRGIRGLESIVQKDGEVTTVIAETEHLCDGEPLMQLQADYRLIAAFRSSAPRLARIAQIAVEALEEAPHEEDCQYLPAIWQTPIQAAASACECTCWKSRALAAIELEAGK